MRSVISGIGVANPPFRCRQADLLEFMCEAHQLSQNEATRLKKLYDASGIAYRYSVLPDFGLKRGRYQFFGNGPALSPFPSTKARMSAYQESAKKVAAQAVENLFEKTESIDIQSITHLITVSCTGMYAPGLDIDIQEKFSLPPDVERTCINFMGCYGAFNALKAADYICRAEENAKVLIVAAELCTLHFQRENTLNNWLSNSLFSDGAGAVLVESANKRSTPKGLELNCFYNKIIADFKKEMRWTIGDTGFDMYLSTHIAKNIKIRLREVIDSLTTRAGLSLSDLSHVAIHPGGRRIVEACEEAWDEAVNGFQHSYNILREYGNMSSVTILFVLSRLLEETRQGETVMSFSFGPGLTFESMVLKTV